MDLNQFTQFFDNPKVSVFDRSKPVGFPAYIGKWYPVKWDLLSFGNSERTRDAHKLRMSPMLAPNFSDLRVEEHAAVVPLRVLMKDYEETFNYAVNRDGASLPSLTPDEYQNLVTSYLGLGYSLQDSLLDFLGYPIYSDVYRAFRQRVYDWRYFNGEKSLYILQIPTVTILQDVFTLTVESSLDVVYRHDTYYLPTKTSPLFLYMFGLDINDFEYLDLPYVWLNILKGKGLNGTRQYSIDELIAYTRFETVDSLLNSYFNYLFSKVIVQLASVSNVFIGTKNISLLPLMAYWRVFYDWCTNGNFTNRDELLEQRVFGLKDLLTNPKLNPDVLREVFSIPHRLWDMDYATSLLPTAAVDNAIHIPANSTVLDLAKLTAIQKLALRLSYSKRYRDVVWNIFKIKPSDARLQQSSIIYEKKHNVGIGETLQTSETTSSSVLGAFGGRGYSSGKIDGFHIFCEEPCITMCFFSLVPKTIYKDCTHPLIHVDDILDIPIPDMDVLGNQPVYADIISGNPSDDSVVLGYGRQYQEWLYNLGSIHGDFRTTLDYWYLSREFSDTPVINDDFLRMNSADDFDRIFSVPGAPHAQVDMYFDSKVTRHVHRSVRILI